MDSDYSFTVMLNSETDERLKSMCTAIATVSILLMSIMLFWSSQWQSESFSNSLVRAAQEEPSTDVISNYQEDILNKIKMLQKQFDMVESSVGKMDELESKILRMTEFMKTLPEYTAFSAKNSVNNLKMQNCDFSVVRGTWSASWKWQNDGCEIELPRDELIRCVSRFGKTVLLGDSQTSRLYHILLQIIQSSVKCEVLRKGNRCGLVTNYYGMSEVPVQRRSQPKPSELEGPTSYGKSHPGCTDCGGCNAQLTRCPATNGSSGILDLEFLPVEFARDVELQSPGANTTQEVVALYLSRAKPPPAVVLFNTGLHDSGSGYIALKTSRERFQELYLRNMAWYIGTLERHLPNTTFVFMTTTPQRAAARDKANDSNARIRLMNAVASEFMRARGHRVLDVHPLLSSDRAIKLFSDSSHASGEGGAYYKAVVHLLARRLCGNET